MSLPIREPLPLLARPFALLVLIFSLLLPGPVLAADANQKQFLNAAGLQTGIRAVKRVQNAYSHYRSAGQWNELALLFARDATISDNSSNSRVTGRDNIRNWFMQQAGRQTEGLAEGQLNEHLMLQPIINVSADGSAILGTWHEVALLGHYGIDAGWKGGIYEARYVLEDGVWRIGQLDYYWQYKGAYEDDGHAAPPAWNVPYHFSAAHVGLSLPASALTNPMSAAADMNTAAASIDRMQQETAVTNLQHSLGYYLDRKLWDDVSDLFATDSSMTWADTGVYRTPARIHAGLEALFGPAGLRKGELFDHIMLSTLTEVGTDGQHAVSRTKVLSQLGRNGNYARWELGEMQNTYVKDKGVWKVQDLQYVMRMASDYDAGWDKSALPALTASVQTAPDAPTARRYAPYPAVDLLPLPFANPGTGTSKSAAGMAPADAATLQKRLHAMVAVDAVENLNSSYGYYIDESAWDNMAATFSSTGSKEITGVGVYVGPERIGNILNRRGPRGGRRANFYTIHQLVQPVIHVSEDGSYANARMRLFQSGGNADGSSGSWIGGIYENTANFENGEWKFGRQDLHHLFFVSYRNGWARVGEFAPTATTPTAATTNRREVRGGGMAQGLGGAASPNQFAADYPPDREIRARQYTFPDIPTLAFHYRNPVSGRAPAELLP
ncbi:MAG: nuclear transport factor 2 family protein [Gammaproteobacteria bacterium]|nr:nuclear transport factor 2 family protein [Gammaproteobacteria bacterium]